MFRVCISKSLYQLSVVGWVSTNFMSLSVGKSIDVPLSLPIHRIHTNLVPGGRYQANCIYIRTCQLMVNMITWWTDKTLVSCLDHMHLSVRNDLVNQASYISWVYFQNVMRTNKVTIFHNTSLNSSKICISIQVFFEQVLQNKFPKCTQAQQTVHQTVFLIKGWGLDVSFKMNEWNYPKLVHNLMIILQVLKNGWFFTHLIKNL